jgi:hypothetical protein
MQSWPKTQALDPGAGNNVHLEIGQSDPSAVFGTSNSDIGLNLL